MVLHSTRAQLKTQQPIPGCAAKHTIGYPPQTFPLSHYRLTFKTQNVTTISNPGIPIPNRNLTNDHNPQQISLASFLRLIS